MTRSVRQASKVSNPWENEPKRDIWRDEATGLPCVAWRNHQEAWCGYVGIPIAGPTHLLRLNAKQDEFDVHGGATYGATPESLPFFIEEMAVAIVSGGANPRKMRWFGFDCSHAGDLMPKYPDYGEYRTLEYVRGECASLAKQMAAIDQRESVSVCRKCGYDNGA